MAAHQHLATLRPEVVAGAHPLRTTQLDQGVRPVSRVEAAQVRPLGRSDLWALAEQITKAAMGLASTTGLSLVNKQAAVAAVPTELALTRLLRRVEMVDLEFRRRSQVRRLVMGAVAEAGSVLPQTVRVTVLMVVVTVAKVMLALAA